MRYIPEWRSSPIAVIAAVTVMVAVTVTPAAMRNPEHALDSTHGAANTSPNRAADDTADRAGNPIALIGAFPGPAHDALGVTDVRYREERQRGGRKSPSEWPARHRHDCALDLGSLHLDPLKSGANPAGK
jgi:hypothetical protein